ncbi:MAG: S49 family peptidase [Labilithrix sp.]|nr:S49 family peptidase [Labilithrix sp.]
MKRHRGTFDRRGMLAMRADAWGLTFQIEQREQPFDQRGPVAIVHVEGPLTHHSDWWCDSYDAIKARVSAALESPASTVLLRIDSPGGDVSGCYEAVRDIRALAQSKGKRLVAYADGVAASAGYALACAASEIYVPATGHVGSIGVICTLMDAVEMERRMGLHYEVIASGARKRFGHPSVPIDDAAIANYQREVNMLAGLFFELVAESRPLTTQEIASLEAGVLFGAEAVASKLADEVCTFEALLEKLSSANAASGAEKDTKMGWKEALQKAADDGDEDAKKALQALEGGDDKDKAKADGETGDGDGDDKDKAKADGETGDGDGDDKDKAKAAASGSAPAAAKPTDPMLAMAARLQTVEAKLAANEEADERARLMASRPDFAPEVVAFMARSTIDVVRDAVKSLPRGKVPAKGQVGAAIAALGTAPSVRGATSDDTPAVQTLPPDEHTKVLAGMGIRPEAKPEAAVTQLEGGFTQFKFRPSAAVNTAVQPAEKGKV